MNKSTIGSCFCMIRSWKQTRNVQRFGILALHCHPQSHFSTKNSPFLNRNGLFLVEKCDCGWQCNSRIPKPCTFRVCFHDRIMQMHDPIVDLFIYLQFYQFYHCFYRFLFDFPLMSIDFHWFSIDFQRLSLVNWGTSTTARVLSPLPYSAYSGNCEVAIYSFTWLYAP